ncbi:MAG: GAF domain-containing protein [Deltaproteobacteria bacterium]|nr:GAF domain-containing protein [Deltaproteobacteria bacterium]
MKKVYVIDGPKKGESFALTKDSMTIGRSPDSDICITEIGISRHHATLLKKGDKWYVTDTSSFQGVFVDGEQIERGQEVEIHKRSSLVLGNTIIAFEDKPASEVLTPARDNESQISFFDKTKVLSVKDSTRNYIRSLELLIRVSNILAQSLNIDEVLNEVVDQILALLKRIDRGAILLLNHKTKKLEILVSKIRTEDGVIPYSKINFSKSIVKRAFKEGQPITMSDTHNEDRTDLSESIEIMNIRSVMCIPLKYKGKVIGVIYVDSLGLPDGFRSEDLDLLRGLSNTAAIAIQNARLYEAMKHELTERKQAEKQLENACVELQETRDMLVKSEKLAAVGRLTTGIAHEILNPVNIMSMRLQLMKQKTDLSDQMKYTLDIFQNQLKRVTDIMDTLGRFSRVQEAKITTDNLNKVLQNALKLCAPQLKAKKIQTDMAFHDKLPLLSMERGRIQEAIMSIVTNAVEAMDGSEKKRLAISTKPGGRGSKVLLTISDTGSGIEEKDMGRVFDPFFTTKDPAQNTGLGLFVSQSIIEQHGGKIWVEQAENGGATFFIELPSNREEK